MKNIREIISNNIISLRRHHKMTQLDLARKVNYSDKAISRWENGEVIPDVETLQELSHIFGVPLSYMFESHNQSDISRKSKITLNEVLLQIFVVCIAWVVVTILFVTIQIMYDYSFWQAFVWGVPISSIICLYFNRKWRSQASSIVFGTLLNWSLLTCVYLQFLSYNLWLLFLIGIPVEAAVVVYSIIKYKLKEF